MSLFFLRCCIDFHLIMMLGFMVVLAYLGAVVNEFLYNQWERKGMNIDIYFYV